MFVPISIDKYVSLHLKTNPGENEKTLKERLEVALESYLNGEKCSCGNDIWVVGSATAGHSCFTCITGESHPSGDYEIDSALNKRDKKRRRHIDEMDPTEIRGFFNDEGYEVNPDLETVKKPALCMICLKNYNPGPEDDILCSMNRYDQKDNKDFICHAFDKM